MMNRGGLIIAVLALLFAQVLRAEPAATQSAESASTTRPAEPVRAGKTAIIDIHDEINDYVFIQLKRRIERARALGADTVILRINTYGGAVTAALDISRYLKQQTDLYIIAYVQDKAISAGAAIAISCSEIVMEPNALIGDSAPILLSPDGGTQPMQAAERAKAESPLLQNFYDSATVNGYDPLVVQAMVSVERVIWWIEHKETGKRRFVDQPDYERLVTADNAEWVLVDLPGVPQPLDSDTTLFTPSTDLAVKIGLASGTYTSIQQFAASRGLSITASLESTSGEKLIAWLNSMTVRSVLMTIFFLSLYMSLSTPGHGAAELIAVSALAVLLGVPMLIGHAQWYEILAVVIGLLLIAVELFILPGFGIAGVTGAILVLGGLAMTFLPPLTVPRFPDSPAVNVEQIRNTLLSLAAAIGSSLVLGWWLSQYLPKVPYFGKLVLAGANDGSGRAPTGDFAAVTIDWPGVGAIGKAITRLAPGGTAEFPDDATGDTRPADVICDQGYVMPGTAVIIRQIEGNRIVVRPYAEGETP